MIALLGGLRPTLVSAQTITPVPPVAVGPGYSIYPLTSNETAMFPNQKSLVAGWIVDQASAADITFAKATWGSLLTGLTSPTDKAQALGRAIIDALEAHRGVPSGVMAGLSPFDQYRRAVAGQDSVWCSNLSAVFVRACTCFGIPARIYAMSDYQVTPLNYFLELAPSHNTTEIFDASLGRWVWIDITFYMMGMELNGCGLVNAAEVQRSLDDPVKINFLTATEYSPVTHAQTVEPVLASDQLGDLLWYFTPLNIFSLYKAGQTSGHPTYLYSNEGDLFPRRSDLAIGSIQPLATGVGVSIQFQSEMKGLATFQCQQTYTSDGTPLAPSQTSSAGTFSFSVSSPDAPDGQATEYEIEAVDDSGGNLVTGVFILWYYSPEYYASLGRTSKGEFVIEVDGIDFSTSSVDDWLVDQPSATDVSIAQATWGGVVLPQASPTQQAQAVACALLAQLQAHRGISSILPGTAPFAAYQRAVAGLEQLGGNDLAAIFAHACNCLGIPARVVGLGSATQTGVSSNEVFDVTLNRWVWMDLNDNVIGVTSASFGPANSAELQRCMNYPERLPSMAVSSYDPVAGTVSNAPASANAQVSILQNYFDGVLPLLYARKAPLVPFPVTGKIIPGNFSGSRSQDFVVQNNAGIPLYSGTGSPTNPFLPNLQWWVGSSYSGWGGTNAKIVTGDFNGDAKTDFIIHDAYCGALFTATGNATNPFTVTWLWTPTSNYGGWSDPGAVIVPGDFNGDGKTDFVIHNATAGSVFTATGNPAQPFTVTQLWTPGVVWGNWGDPGAEIIPGDFNGDGKTDFIIHNAKFAGLYIATGNAKNPFTHQQLWNPYFNPDGWATAGPVTIVTGDFNGDGKTDFMVQHAPRIALYTATGKASNPFTVTWLWTAGVNFGGWGDPGAEIIPGDFNGDGKTDFIIHNAQYAALFTATGIPTYPFMHVQLWGPAYNSDGWATAGPATIVPGDFNGDGKTDFIAYNAQQGALYTGTGDPNQPFTVTWLWTNATP